MSQDNPSQPIPTRGRLANSWAAALAKTDKPKVGGDACWGGAATLAEELALLGDFVAPRRIEDAVEQALVNAVAEACQNALHAEVKRIGPPTQCRLAGDAALLCCVTTKPADALAKELEKDPANIRVDAVDDASQRTACGDLLLPGATIGVVLVERASGARAHIALVPHIDYAEALRLRNADAAARFAALAPRSTRASAAPRVFRTAFACSGLDSVRGLGWSALAAALGALNEKRRAPSKARRGDEASLELCARPLYVNDQNVLREKDDGGLGDDGEFLSFCSDSVEGEEARKVLADLKRRVLAAHRGGGLTCEQLRRDSRRSTYKTGSYFTDDGDLEELDRDLVDKAKGRLQNGELLQRPLDLFDAPVAPKIVYSKETALVVTEDDGQPAAKKRRGGALKRLVESAKVPPPLFGPPPPRTPDEQRCAAAVDCARLELEETGGKNNSVLGAALPGGALRDLRARQLLAIFLRSCGSVNRGSDVMSGPQAYAGCLLRVLEHDAPYPDAWSPREPLGAQGALWRVTRLGDSNVEHREAALRPAALHGTARDCKARADVADDAFEAIGHLTAALGAMPASPVLLAQRAAAYLACDLTNHARSDAARCLALAPAWDGALRCAAQVSAASQPMLSALQDYAALVRRPAPAPSDVVNEPPVSGDVAWLKSAADTKFRAKRLPDAIAAYTRALARAADDDDVEPQTVAALFSNRAAAAMALHAYADALRDGAAAAATKPDWVKGHVRVALALRALHLPQEAIGAYHKALRCTPGDAELNLGLCDAVEKAATTR